MADKQIMIISVMDRDRAGIVADVTEGIRAQGGNLADLRQQVLCGYFSMIFIATFPEELSAASVEDALAKGTGSRVLVECADSIPADEDPSDHVSVLTAVARDRACLVALVSRFCSERSINILDLSSHVDSEKYAMMLQLDLSDIESLDNLRAELATFGESNGLNLVLQHNDIFRATNEV